MTVYADVLIILNFAVDYFLIKLSGKLLSNEINNIRLVLSSIIGALFSLYIFFPEGNIFFRIILRIFMSSLISVTAYKIRTVKAFLRNTAVIFGVTFSYGGIMFALFYFLRPNGMVVNNSIVYFNISPLLLILVSVIYYFTALIIKRCFGNNLVNAEKCKVKVKLLSNETSFTAIIDTGNGLKDVFGQGEIIIVRETFLNQLKKGKNDADLMNRYRAIPCNTAIGNGLLHGIRADFAKIEYNKKTREIKSPIIVSANTKLDSDAEAIISPRVLI